MKFEIDVSGSDIFDEHYTICIANKDEEDHIIKGFRFNNELITQLVDNWKSKKYRYELSKKQRGIFKIRLYSIVIYYLFKSIQKQDKVSLTICRDFHGHQNDIDQNLKYFLETKLNISIGKPRHQKLPKESNAHWYAYLMRKDNANQMQSHIDVSLKDIEEHL